ncbi:MAG TPA: PKD domain-containing protein [Solirubrobacterales bacterium]|nr:PKD domain-containing protein [Solirubrobacterales bacterium]
MDRFSVSLRGLAALAVVCAFACFGVPSAGAAPLLWGVDTNTGSVSTFEVTGGREVGLPIETGESPDSIAITPDGRRAYVTNSVGKSVTVIEAGTRIPIATIPLSAAAESIAISPDGRTAYVTVAGSERVVTISTESNLITGSIAGGTEPSAMAISPNGEAAYVGVAPEDVQMVSPRNGTPMGLPVEVGGVPQAIAFAPDGNAAYVAAGNEVDVLQGGAVVKAIPVSTATGLAVSPDGTRVYVTSRSAKTVTTIDTATGEVTGTPIFVGGEPGEIALTADGRSAFVGTGGALIVPIDLTTGVAGAPITRIGAGFSALVVAPDQPPIAAFDPPQATVGVPATFSAAPSTDPDGSIATYQWRTNFGGSPVGVTFTHTFTAVDNYFTMLTVTDAEGCGPFQVFTGRTAYCNGGAVATVTHPVPVKAAGTVCSANFRIRGVTHNRRNGTVRLRLKFPGTGWFLIFGKKIHAVTRKVRKPGSAVVTLHARVELNKRLKKTLRARVRYRITFTPSAGCRRKTVHRSVALLRAPRKRHHH